MRSALLPPLRPTTLPPRRHSAVGRSFTSWFWGGLFLCAVGLGSGARADLRAQGIPVLEGECPQGRISDLFVDNHSIFDPVALPRSGLVRAAYTLANGIHIRTRREFIESQLLFQIGDCLDPERVRESARVLRQFRFLAAVDAYPVPQADGSQHIVVDTRDDWSTKLSVGVRVEGRLRFDGISMVEENFLGRGATVGVFYLDRDAQRDVGARFELPRVQGSGWDLEASGGRTRVGSAFSQGIIHPFRGELGRFAFRQRARMRRDLFAWSMPGDAGPSHLVVPLETGRVEATVAGRFGVPGTLLLLGGGVSSEWVFPGPLEEVDAVLDLDFSTRGPPPPGSAEELGGQLQRRRANRLNLLTGLRQIQFEERRRLDLLGGLQDVAVGREVLLTLGQQIGGRDSWDTFARTDIFAGFSRPATVGQLFLSLEGRGLEAAEGITVREGIGEGHFFLYQLLPGPWPQTLVFRLAGQRGWRMDAPYQITLGGPDGVRGYGETELPGAGRWVLSVEDRISLPGPFSELLDLGVTLFADGGRIFAGDVPFGLDSGWRGTLGLGIRAGFPAGSSSVIRADLAFPIDAVAGRSPVVRIHAQEWLGILGRFASPAVERSRRSGVSAEFVGAGRGRP
jgi:hypothetical protein